MFFERPVFGQCNWLFPFNWLEFINGYFPSKILVDFIHVGVWIPTVDQTVAFLESTAWFLSQHRSAYTTHPGEIFYFQDLFFTCIVFVYNFQSYCWVTIHDLYFLYPKPVKNVDCIYTSSESCWKLRVVCKIIFETLVYHIFSHFHLMIATYFECFIWTWVEGNT